MKGKSVPLIVRNDFSVFDAESVIQLLVLYKDSYTVNLDEVKLNKNQIIVTLDVYNAIFNDDRTQNYYCQFSESPNVLKYPTHLGEKVKMELFDATDNVGINSFNEVEIVGLYCSRMFGDGQKLSNIYAGNEDWNTLLQDTVQYQRIDFAVKNDKSYMENTLTDLRKSYILANNYFTQSIYEFENSFSVFKDMFMAFGSILLVFSIVMFANFISVSILNRKKDIGIIRAIGGSEKNVFKIFFTEGLIFVVIVSVLAIIVSFSLTVIMNELLVKSMIDGCVLLVYNPLNILIVPSACFLVMLITTYFPIRKISKRSPVDIIRNN